MGENGAMRKDAKGGEIARFLEAWMRARGMIQAANFNRFQREGLSATQFMTLNLLPVNEKGLTLSELARRMNLGMATVTKTVDSLQARGMLTRTKSDGDRRMIHIALTEDGKSLQNAASREFHEHMATLFETMNAKQRMGLIEGLECLAAAGSSPLDGEAEEATREADDGLRATRSSQRSPRR